ncbi:copper chaperone PCu(A)C [uncultured Sulfitobacter sp.]|uniref:copper chaperone PCu(A)C n=1 Tax=uncultured Sulfitobacter sp. TaxID=191468 RepID=UPI00263995E1|nr:copper chaperone PCu(A)C [uncultured Sulfitobacter sp.]
MVQNRSTVIAVAALVGLLAVVMAVVSVKLSPLDKSDAAFVVEQAYVTGIGFAEEEAVTYLSLTNRTGQDDRLIGARSALAHDAMLHRQGEGDAGAAPTTQITDGIALPDGAQHRFAPGGDHLMLSRLIEPLVQGAIVPITLVFERAGDVPISVLVDLDR